MSFKEVRNLQGKELEKFKSEFKIESYWAPTTYTSMLDGQKYAIGMGSPWIPIPHAMTQKEVHEKWIKKELKKPDFKVKKTIESSKGKNKYEVIFDGSWQCSCSGYKFRKNCSHIEKVKKEIKLKIK